MSKINWGAVFDFDGVLINSAAHHEESWERLAREEKQTLPPDHFKRSFGMKNAWIIPNLLNWSHEPADIERLSLRKEELYREVVKERGISLLPGVIEFLKYLREAGVPCVIGSSTQKLNITTAFELLGIAPYFQGMTTSEDVDRGKPDPQVFLVAASKIDLLPSRCVVFEDALVGIEAGLAAGMHVIAVTTTHPAAELSKAHLVVDRLDQIPAKTFTEWFGQ